MTLQRFQPINIGAHRLAARRIHADHATIESRNYRLYFTFKGSKGKVDDVLAALVEIRMRKLKKGGQNIGVVDALAGEMTVRIKLRGNEDMGADNAAGPLKQITLAIIIPLRHHGTMQTKDHGINRQCRLQLAKDLVTQTFIGPPLQKSARLRPGCRTLDQFEAFRFRPAPKHHHGRRAQGRRFRMLARRRIERHFEAGAIRGHWGEGIGFGRERGGKNAHGRLSHWVHRGLWAMASISILMSIISRDSMVVRAGGFSGK